MGLLFSNKGFLCIFLNLENNASTRLIMDPRDQSYSFGVTLVVNDLTNANAERLKMQRKSKYIRGEASK